MHCSIIICTHNRSSLLENCLSEISKQNFDSKNIEVIVVDNNSKDDTKQVVDSTRGSFPFELIYHLEIPLGLSYARNAGLRIAKGEYLIFIDDDARPKTKDWISSLVKPFENPEIAVVGGKISAIWPDTAVPDWLPETLLSPLSISSKNMAFNTELTYPNLPWGANIAYRKKFINDYGLLFDTKLGRVGSSLLSGEETLVSAQLISRGKKVTLAENAEVAHLIDKERLSKGWFLSQAYSQGLSDAYLENKILTSYQSILNCFKKSILLGCSYLGEAIFSLAKNEKLKLLFTYQINKQRTYLKHLMWEKYQLMLHAYLNPLNRIIFKKLSLVNLKKIDGKNVPSNPSEIRAFIKIKNEKKRLPYLLKYYRSLGVDRFFIIDNGSTDETSKYCLMQDDVHLYATRDHFSKQVSWLELLLNEHGKNHWCLLIDSDELMVFSDIEHISLKDLCKKLDTQGDEAVEAILLDLYSKEEINLATYEEGSNPLEKFCYFDAELPGKRSDGKWIGGVRERLFGFTPDLIKYPLFKYNNRISFTRGLHSIFGARIASIRVALLHTKLTSDLIKKAREENFRRSYYKKSIEYKHYLEKLSNDNHLSAYSSNSSKFKDSRQLLELGFLQ